MTRPWGDIAGRYRQVVEAGMSSIGGMLRLVEQIRASPYARGLHAWTSMHDLCIVQVPCTHPYDGPYLRISPRFDRTIEFRYLDTPMTSKQWHRVVKEEDAFRQLERFIDQLHWMVRARNRDRA